MQSASSRIWTRVTVSICYDDNHYTTGTGPLTNALPNLFHYLFLSRLLQLVSIRLYVTSFFEENVSLIVHFWWGKHSFSHDIFLNTYRFTGLSILCLVSSISYDCSSFLSPTEQVILQQSTQYTDHWESKQEYKLINCSWFGFIRHHRTSWKYIDVAPN